jgi:hypothetical protein
MQGAAICSHEMSAPLACSAASASGTAYACSTSPTFTPAAGDTLIFLPDVANTASATLSVNGQSAKPLKKQAGAAGLVANDLLASPAPYLLIYDGVNWDLQGPTGNAGGGSATITDGYLMPFGGFNAFYSGGFTPAAGTVYYYKFTPSAASFSWKSIIFLMGATAGSTHAALALMDANCNKVAGTDINLTGLQTGGSNGYVLAHPGASPTVLTGGAPYYLAIVGEAAYGWTSYGQNPDAFFFSGITDNPFFTGAAAPTGTGVSLAVPPACGLRTRVPDATRPIFYLSTNN